MTQSCISPSLLVPLCSLEDPVKQTSTKLNNSLMSNSLIIILVLCDSNPQDAAVEDTTRFLVDTFPFKSPASKALITSRLQL